MTKRISVVGLGYVGCVTAACLADSGNDVIGIDVNQLKVDMINTGKTPIIENDIGDIVMRNAEAGRLRATNDILAAISETEISLVCVGTPSQPNGNLDLTYVERVCAEIGACLKAVDHRHHIVIRSTILPGTMRDLVIPTLEKNSGKTASVGFSVSFNPEFLREGTSIHDYYNPPKIVVGNRVKEDAGAVSALYEGIEAPLFIVDLETAEMVKYVDNVFHGLKVCFANEIGNICKEISIDSHDVMEIFCSDTKLNLSSYYLKPGFAFGGSCIPKDLRALTYKANALDLKTPVLSSILDSNQYQIFRALNMVLSRGKKRIGVLGFSFKEGTDDLRESPMVTLIESLIGKGYQLKIYDRNVNLAKLFGANKEYIESHIEHISKLMTDDVDELFEFAEIILIGNKSEEFAGMLAGCGENQTIIDLVRIGKEIDTPASYEGLCW